MLHDNMRQTQRNSCHRPTWFYS